MAGDCSQQECQWEPGWTGNWFFLERVGWNINHLHFPEGILPQRSKHEAHAYVKCWVFEEPEASMTCWVLQSRACRESMPVHVTYAHLGMQEGKVANPQKMNRSFIGSNSPPPGDIWHCLETYLVAKNGGRGGTSGSWRMFSQGFCRVGHNWGDLAHTHVAKHPYIYRTVLYNREVCVCLCMCSRALSRVWLFGPHGL